MSSTIAVNVQIPVVGEEPYCNFTAPTNGATVNEDVDENTAGFQFAVGVTCGGVLSDGTAIADQNVRVIFDNGAPVTTALAGGTASLQFTAATEGENKTLSVALEADSTVSTVLTLIFSFLVWFLFQCLPMGPSLMATPTT